MAFIGAVGIAASLSACSGSSASSDTTVVARTKNAALTRPTCDAVTPCKIGDTGKGGGTIFYVSQSGFRCGATMTSTCNFLEYAPMNWAAQGGNISKCTPTSESRDLLCSWSLVPTLIGAKALTDGLGAGLANTSLLQSASANAMGGYDSNAANSARNYTGSNMRSAYYLQDWYIPTLAEAVELCKYANGNSPISNTCSPGTLKSEFTADNYWTSNPANAGVGTNATALHFGNGVATGLDRTTSRLVRPIRAFAGTLDPSIKTTTTIAAPPTTQVARTTVAPTTLAPTTTMRATTTTVLSCALGGPCAVGNAGPGGGTVIYANAAGFACGASRTSTCRYLEVAPATWYTTVTTTNCGVNNSILICRWSDVNTKLAGTENTGIGYGLQNTNAMVAQSSTTGNAGVVTRAYRGGGFADWALPSAGELTEVCKYAKPTFPGSISCGGSVRLTMANNISWWSSNDTSATEAPAKSFYNAIVAPMVKTTQRSILPIRAF